MNPIIIKSFKGSAEAEAWLAEQINNGYLLISFAVTKEGKGHLYHFILERK